MNVQQAYTLLQASPSTSDDELRKKFKQMAKTLHPDINKEPDAEKKFKEINAAYQTIESARKNPPQQQGFGGINFQDIFGGGFGRRGAPLVHKPNIEMKETVSFRESVIGAERSVSYTRDVKCNDCNGNGVRRKNNGCAECGGQGIKISQAGNSMFQQTCQKCRGAGGEEDCAVCNRQGFVSRETKLTVQIPPGVIDGNVMQLEGAGHFIQHSIFGDAYSNVLIAVAVEKAEGLSIVNGDVVHILPITLLEALKGAMKSVPTIDGEKLIEVPALSKNGGEVVMPGLGINRFGNQRVVLDVSYPEDTKPLIELMEG